MSKPRKPLTYRQQINRYWHTTRNNAKKCGHEQSLTHDDIERMLAASTQCEMYNEPLQPAGGKGDFVPSFDRFDPALGYVPGNVYVISWKANERKGKNTIEDVRLLLAWMERVNARKALDKTINEILGT